MLDEQTNLESDNMYLEHDLEFFKDWDINLNAEELDNHLPNILINNLPRPQRDFIINNKKYSYSAYLLKLLKKKPQKEQKPETINILQNPFGNK